MYSELKGRTALVTGAGQGIGRAIALALAEAGVDVAVNIRSSVDLAEETADLARAHGVRAVVRQADVTDRDAVFEMVDRVVADFGQIDICVNNAGGGQTFGIPLQEMDPGDWQRPIELTVAGAFNVCQAVGRHMVPRGSGAVVNISSTASKQPLPFWGAYSTAKLAVEMLTRQLAMEWARGEGSTIRVNAIAPGLILTPRTAPAIANPAIMEPRVRMIPMGRAGEPREIADVAVFLASDRASYLTGQVLVVDGGECEYVPGMADWALSRKP